MELIFRLVRCAEWRLSLNPEVGACGSVAFIYRWVLGAEVWKTDASGCAEALPWRGMLCVALGGA